MRRCIVALDIQQSKFKISQFGIVYVDIIIMFFIFATIMLQRGISVGQPVIDLVAIEGVARGTKNRHSRSDEAAGMMMDCSYGSESIYFWPI